MSLVRTGPGTLRVVSLTQHSLKVVLGSFDIDGDVPKREHLDFIDTRLVPALIGTGAHADVVGAASHSNTDAHNLELSGRRAHNVFSRLIDRHVPASQVRIHAAGEFRATPGLNEADPDRNVTVYVGLNRRVPPPPPPPPPALGPGGHPVPDYQIRMMGGFGLEGVFGHDHIGFQVWDRANHMVAIYQYTGGNAGIGGGVSIRGGWNSIPGSSNLTFQDLEGWARYGGMGYLCEDQSYLIMRGHPAGRINIHLDPFQTGCTLGAGISAGVGRLELVGAPVPVARFNAERRFWGYYNVP